MKNFSKKLLSLLLAVALIVTTLVIAPLTSGAATAPQSLESYTFKFWVDPENTITQADIDSFNSGTKTTMVGAISPFRVATSGNYYLFLPSNADCNALRVWFSGTAQVTVDGVTTDLVSGETTNAFASINEGGVSKTCSVKLGTSSYTVVVMKSGDVGTVYIDTTSGSIKNINSSKSNSDTGTILVVDADGNVNYDGEMTKMQGRGNGTWDGASGYGKYPYNVKLAASASLLGMSKAKKWCLLANNNDTSLVKNQLAYDFADYIGIKYQPHCKPVDLYVNQQYFGSYQLSEKVQIKSNRINVIDAYENLEIANGTETDELTGQVIPADLSGAPAKAYNSSGSTVTIGSTSYAAMCTVGNRKYSTNKAGSSSGSGSGIGSIIPGLGGGSSSTGPALVNPDDITGGYLYELEISKRWVGENAGFCAYNRQGWVMKSCDVATKDMVDYSYDLLFALGSSVYNETNPGTVPSGETITSCSSANPNVRTTKNPAPNSKYHGKKWSNILDADSAVKYYWTQEYFKNMDSSTSSTYFYKDSDSIDPMLYAGPVWDMDNSFGYEISGSRWGYSYTSSSGWYTKNARIYRYYANDSGTGYSSDSQSPLNFYAALATNCTDFWGMAKSYWYTKIEPATQVLLGSATDPRGVLHSTEYYVNTVSKSNTMDNVRLQLNSSSAYNYSNMISSMNQWISERNTFINGEFPKANISSAICSSIPAQNCTGKPITPDFTLSLNGTTLQKDIDYTVEYSNNIEVGNANIAVTGKGVYTGSLDIPFSIVKGSLSGGNVTIPESAYERDTLFAVVKNANGDRINSFITYQWKVNGADILGATSNSYTIDSQYKGSNITVEVKGDGVNLSTDTITSNICQVSNEDKPRGMTKTIATWNYDYTADSSALLTADETGLTYYYRATSGEYAETAELTASVDAVNKNKIKWSGSTDTYTNTSTTISPDQSPVMGTSKTDLLSWGQYPYFETTVSTLQYEDITFSAKLGGTKKAPASWKLQYSTDGVDYTDVEGATYIITNNKKMEQAFTDIQLPSECNNKQKVYIRMVANANVAISGVDTIVGSLSGDAAVNNIEIIGTSTQSVTTLEAPTITTSSNIGDGSMVFASDMVSVIDNNGGADLYYSINGSDFMPYTQAFSAFDGESASYGDTVTISAYAGFNDVVSQTVDMTLTFAGVDIISFSYDNYSQNVSNGAVFSTGGVYDKSGKMTAYTDGKSQYVPLWNNSKGSFSVSPDDGAKWSSQSGFTYELSTAGYTNIRFTAKAFTTGQGPKSVSLQSSPDGVNWSTVQSNVQLQANGELNQAFLNVALPSDCANKAKVYVRLVTTENQTHGDEINPVTTLFNNESKGNLYVNDVVVAGEDDGTYKMPYTNKKTNYFGSNAINYYSPSSQAMQFVVKDPESKTISSGAYPADGINISLLQGFNPYVAGPYTITIWAGDDDDKSIYNTRQYYYKGETITKFNYSDSKKPLGSYLIENGTKATNTSGSLYGALSMFPDSSTPALLKSDNKYGVKITYSADNPFTATKNLDTPNNNGYWLIETSTTGYTDVTLNLEQLSSNNGPRDWGLAYSLDGSNYTYIQNSNVRAISSKAATSTVETYNNFALPEECYDKENLYIKVFINGGETVDGDELELVQSGNTGMNSIELSGIAIPVERTVTINTVVLETKTATTGSVAVDAGVIINGTEYETENGSITITAVDGEQLSISASVNSTFVNTVSATVDGDMVITIPLVSIDINSDGIINGKDFAYILKSSNMPNQQLYREIFSEFMNVRDTKFIYTK